MTNYYDQMPDKETIDRYYGSMEAYQEEQRRVALLNLEETTNESGSNWNWDYTRRFRQTPVLGRAATRRNGLRAFHLFGRHN